MINWFDTRARLLQMLLLIIPGVGYFILLGYYFNMLLVNKSVKSFFVFILNFVLGLILVYVNFFVIIYNHYLLFSEKKDV